jgi:hypothetical protein
LPVCRWRLEDILLIDKRFAGSESAYAIARSLSLSLAVLLHLHDWLAKAATVVAALLREMGLMDAAPPRPAAAHPGETLARASRVTPWARFTHSFSRAFYPKRFPVLRSHTILTG